MERRRDDFPRMRYAQQRVEARRCFWGEVTRVAADIAVSAMPSPATVRRCQEKEVTRYSIRAAGEPSWKQEKRGRGKLQTTVWGILVPMFAQACHACKRGAASAASFKRLVKQL